MPYRHRVGTNKIRTYPPIATVYVEFFFSSNVCVVLVRQFVHLTNHFFSATQPKGPQALRSTTTHKSRTSDGGTETVIYMVPHSCSPERDLLISGGTGTRKLRSVAALIALTLRHGTVPVWR